MQRLIEEAPENADIKKTDTDVVKICISTF